jgi:hypothetical protein
VEDADLHPFLIAQEGDIYCARNMVLLEFERGPDIDNTVGVEKCFTKYRYGGHIISPEDIVLSDTNATECSWFPSGNSEIC